MASTCPVCGFPELEHPPRSQAGGGSHEICPSCGFQFGVSDDDDGISPGEWRVVWIADGMKWFSRGFPQPPKWNPARQLKNLVGSGGSRPEPRTDRRSR